MKKLIAFIDHLKRKSIAHKKPPVSPAASDINAVDSRASRFSSVIRLPFDIHTLNAPCAAASCPDAALHSAGMP